MHRLLFRTSNIMDKQIYDFGNLLVCGCMNLNVARQAEVRGSGGRYCNFDEILYWNIGSLSYVLYLSSFVETLELQ